MCPYCTSFQPKTAKGGGGYILIFYIYSWDLGMDNLTAKDLSGDARGLRDNAERIMHSGGYRILE